MDTMYRKKVREAQEALVAAKENKKKEKHAADGYQSRLRPRETHPDPVDAKKRISKNLNKLNRDLVEAPVASPVKEEEAFEASSREDRGVRVMTRRTASKPIPVAMIFACVLIAAVFMYTLSLSVKIEEKKQSIDTMKTKITALKDEATKLEVQLENKYDLDEVERIATQQYGMVPSSALPKKYVTISKDTQVWQSAQTEDNSLKSFFEHLFSSEKEE